MSEDRPRFGTKAIASITQRLPTDAPPEMGEPDELVPFATFITRDLYLQLLERVYHDKGFVMQEAVAEGLKLYIATLSTPRQPLPPARLGRLLQTNKKLRKG